MAEPRILFVAGEPSGDLHASFLIRELKRLHPGIKTFGMGGARMKEEGVEILQRIEDLAVVGLWEVVYRLPKIRKALSTLCRALKERKPDLLLLIDYPGFNLRLARQAKKEGFKVLYYITPQVWAWGKWRLRQMKRWVDRAIVILPFEEKLFQDVGVPTTFVGHPLLDIVHSQLSRSELCHSLKLSPAKPLIGLLPGSRKGEVERILPLMLQCAEEIQKEIKASFVVPLAPGIEQKEIWKRVKHRYPRIGSSSELRIINGNTYEVMKNADLLLVASGSATLEAALLGTPMVILYKLSPLSYWIGKRIVRVQNLGLVNIVAERRVVPEFIQSSARPSLVVPEAISLLTDEDRRNRMRQDLKEVKERLGEPGAPVKAAKAVLEEL